MNCGREEFGTSRILAALSGDVDDELQAVRDAVSYHCHDTAPHDDMTMVSIRAIR
jgi:hypothetical protein